MYIKSVTQLIPKILSNSKRLSSTIKGVNIENADKPIVMENPFEKEKQKCILCRMNITPDFKNTKLLSQFQSSYTGRIYGRNITGLCKAKQEKVEIEIIKAQGCALMGSYHKSTEFLKDPKLFDPERPIRSHKY